MTSDLPPRLHKLITEFADADRSERLEMLVEYSDRLPALPEWLRGKRDRMDQVHECMTPTFIHAEHRDGGMQFYFDISPESPTVRGVAALLAEGLDGAPPQQVVAVSPEIFWQMGLHTVLSPQRLNGITALLAHLKRLTARSL